MEQKTVFLVSSNAGYGVSIRAKFEDPQQATLKAERLAKKGHTDIEISEATIISTTKYGADA